MNLLNVTLLLLLCDQINLYLRGVNAVLAESENVIHS